MGKALVVALALGMLGGCGFAQGFRDEGLRQAGSIAADEVERRLGDDFKELSDALGDIPQKDPISDTAGYGLGALLAYVLGSVGKGLIRAKMADKKNA